MSRFQRVTVLMLALILVAVLVLAAGLFLRPAAQPVVVVTPTAVMDERAQTQTAFAPTIEQIGLEMEQTQRAARLTATPVP